MRLKRRMIEDLGKCEPGHLEVDHDDRANEGEEDQQELPLLQQIRLAGLKDQLRDFGHGAVHWQVLHAGVREGAEQQSEHAYDQPVEQDSVPRHPEEVALPQIGEHEVDLSPWPLHLSRGGRLLQHRRCRCHNGGGRPLLCMRIRHKERGGRAHEGHGHQAQNDPSKPPIHRHHSPRDRTTPHRGALDIAGGQRKSAHGCGASVRAATLLGVTGSCWRGQVTGGRDSRDRHKKSGDSYPRRRHLARPLQPLALHRLSRHDRDRGDGSPIQSNRDENGSPGAFPLSADCSRRPATD